MSIPSSGSFTRTGLTPARTVEIEAIIAGLDATAARTEIAAEEATVAALSATSSANSAAAAAASAISDVQTTVTAAQAQISATADEAIATVSAYEGSASASASSATASASTATAAATTATTARDAAAGSATAAANSASTAASSSSTAVSARDDALAAKTAAETAKGAVDAAAQTADQRATAANTSATNAATSASTSSGHASAASTSATNAGTARTAAETARTAAETAKTAAETARTTATTAATNAGTARTGAETARDAAAGSATAAGTAKTAAEAARDAAITAKDAAETAAGNASSKASLGVAQTWTAAQTFLSGTKVGTAAGEAQLILDATDGTAAFLHFRKDGKKRWDIAGHYASDTGSNAGTDLAIARYADNGDYIDLPLTISRATGQVNLNDGASVNGNLTVSNTVTATTQVTSPRFAVDPNAYWQLQSGNPLINFDATDYLQYNRSTNTLQLFIGSTSRMNITATSVNATVPVLLPTGQSTNTLAAVHKTYVDTTFLPKSGGTVTGDLSTGFGTIRTVSGIHRIDHTSDGWSETWSTVNGTRTWTSPSATQMTLDPSNNLTIAGSFSTSSYSGMYIGGYQNVSGNFVTTMANCNPNWEPVTVQAVHIPSQWAGYRILVGSVAQRSWDFRSDGHAYSGGNWVAASDGRVKADREIIADPLVKIAKLTGYTYTRTDLGGQRDVGLIAQDVRTVLPEAVRVDAASFEGGQGFHSMNYNGLIALQVEAIKALVERNANLEARLAAMEARYV